MCQQVSYTAAVHGHQVASPLSASRSLPNPTGPVNFSDGGRPIAGCQDVALDGTGAATCTPDAYRSAGTHTITAAYSGDNDYSAGASGPLTQTVLGAPTVAITGRPSNSTSTTATVGYTETGPVTGTACTLDSKDVPCDGTHANLTVLAIGRHTFTVTVSGLAGTGSDSATWTTQAPPAPPAPPVAHATTVPAAAPMSMTLSASGSHAATGHHLVAYRWTLNGRLIGAGPVITHRFTAPARYPVLLTITDEKGVTATSTVVVTVHGTVTVIRELTVHFARSQWTLTEASIGALKGIRPAVLHSAHVTINGYSSDNQHEHAALQLAWNRAHTVGKFLLSGAPKPAGMTVAGHYGHYLASNRTPAGRVANRRVVITWTVSQYR